MANKISLHNEKELKASFNALYKPLVRYAHRFLVETSASEDVVQDIFVNLYQEKRVFENEQVLQAYCYKAVKNTCLNRLKHEKVKQNYAKEILHTTKRISLFEFEVETANVIHKALTQLSHRKKEIVTLHLKGLTNKDIANRLNIKLQTVKNSKANAFKELKGFISKSKKS